MARVDEVMSRPVVAVGPSTCVSVAEALAERTGFRHLVVEDSGALVGVLCVCDLWRAEPEAPVSRCMATTVYTIDPEQPAGRAWSVMLERGVGCLPVVSAGKLVGIVTRRDLRRAGIAARHKVPGRCASCGSDLHVIPWDPNAESVGFCGDCLDRSEKSRSTQDDLGAGD